MSKTALTLLVLASSACVTTTRIRPVNDEHAPIVQTGAAVLRASAAELSAEEIRSPEIQQLIKAMVEIMRQAPGVGLAAPQIGISKQVIVLEDRPEFVAGLSPTEAAERERVPFSVRVFINPVLTPIGDEKVSFFEGCLSVAGFGALVSRWREVEVNGLDEKGEPQRWRVNGWPARILQHEVDHINGMLYVDRMLTRSFSTQAQLKERLVGKTGAEIRAMFGAE